MQFARAAFKLVCVAETLQNDKKTVCTYFCQVSKGRLIIRSILLSKRALIYYRTVYRLKSIRFVEFQNLKGYFCLHK